MTVGAASKDYIIYKYIYGICEGYIIEGNKGNIGAWLC